MSKLNRQLLLPNLLLILLPFGLFWRWVIFGEVIFWGTPLFQFWPWHHLTKTIALSGEWPLWNPLLGNGTPLLANLQTAFFYPPNLIYLFMPVEHALMLSVILHLGLAGVTMYGYARQIRLSSFAALIAALTYMFSGYLVGRIQFITMINALAWFPLLLLLVEWIVTRPGYGPVLGLGLVWAVQLLAGHAQLWFYGVWLTGAYALFRSWQTATAPPGSTKIRGLVERLKFVTRRGVSSPAGAGLLALLLAAVQLVPTAEFTGQSPRNTGAERMFALSYSFWPWRLITLIAPNFFGNPAEGTYWGYATYWEDHAYAGVLPFLLALIALWRYFRSLPQSNTPALISRSISPPSVLPFFAGLIPISLVLAMGWNTPIYPWVFDHVPGFGYFQAPSRLLIWYTIAIAILAGIGAQSLATPVAGRQGWQRGLVACGGVALAGALGNFALSGRSLTFLTATTTLGLFLAGAITLLLIQPGRNLTRLERSGTLAARNLNRWRGTVLAFITLDLLWMATQLTPLLPPTIYQTPIETAELIGEQPGDYRFWVEDRFDEAVKFEQYFDFQTFGPADLNYWQQLKETLVPNFGVYAGLASANNDDPLVVSRWHDLTGLLVDLPAPQQARLLALMNVGYRIKATATEGKVVYQNERMAIQPVAQPLPRAYFVSQAYMVETAEDAITRLSSTNFDPYREVIIMKDNNDVALTATTPAQRRDTGPTGSTAGAPPVSALPVTIQVDRPNRVTLTLQAPATGFVILTDTFYPGWQARLNEQPAPIWPANLAFRAVAVEAGPQEIIFEYRPRSFSVGGGISLITLLLVLIAFFILLKRDAI